MAINIANYIALAEECAVKAIDLSGTGNLRFAKGKKVTFIVHSNIDIPRLQKTSRAIIYDFGTPYNISSKGKLLSNNENYSETDIELFKSCEHYFRGCYQIRNEWMVDRSARVIAVFNGEPSGTKNTVVYAQRKGIEVKNVLE